MSKNPVSRRQFMQIGSGALVATTVAKNVLQPRTLYAARPVAPSDTVRFASIGTGIRGCEHLEASLHVPGIQCVAVCDLYDSRHTAAQEAVNNPSVPATRDYRSILDRKDVDSVLIATMDHNHRQIFEDACAAGKDIYCEKPMSHTVEDGFAMMEAAHKHNRMVAIGSQRVSSVLYAKAKEIYDCCGIEFNIGSPRQLGDVLIDPPRVHLAGGEIRVDQDVVQKRDVGIDTLDAEFAQRTSGTRHCRREIRPW